MATSDSDEDSRYIVPSLRRGLAILRLFNRQRRAISVPEIVHELAIPRATAFRLAYTLEADGLLQRLPRTNTFQLGVNILTLGFEYLDSLDLTEIGRPILEDLRNRMDASSHMGIRDGTEVVYIISMSSSHRLRNHVPIGIRMPAHATSIGRALLLDMEHDALKRLYKDVEMLQLNENTPRNVTQLYERLVRDREKGYVSYRSEYSIGIASVAAPIRNRDGQIVAGINISDYESLPIMQQLEGQLKDEVLKAAKEISTRLGYLGE